MNEKINKLEQRNMKEALLDFLLTSQVDIHILNNDHTVINTIKSTRPTVLGEVIMQNQVKNITGEVDKFSYIKIGAEILPIDSEMLKNWAFQTADQSNKSPVLKQQINKDGEEISYIRHNGNIKATKEKNKKLEE